LKSWGPFLLKTDTFGIGQRAPGSLRDLTDQVRLEVLGVDSQVFNQPV
jgi:hypothetical protein